MAKHKPPEIPADIDRVKELLVEASKQSNHKEFVIIGSLPALGSSRNLRRDHQSGCRRAPYGYRSVSRCEGKSAGGRQPGDSDRLGERVSLEATIAGRCPAM